MVRLTFCLMIIFLVILIITCGEEATTNQTEQEGSKIILSSNPSGAQIYLLGTYTGKVTPDSILTLKDGSYEIMLKLTNFLDTTFIVDIIRNLTTTKSVTLTTIGHGNLFINSVPSGAQILVDSQNSGKITPDTLENLLIGNYQITLQLTGYEDTTFTTSIVKDVTKSVDIEFLIPLNNVSYNLHIQPLFGLKCISCHGNGRLEAGLDLTVWSRFVDGRIVVPSEPDNSVLVWTIEWMPGFPAMPPPSFSIPLSAQQIRGVKTWIEEGAMNN